MVTEMSFWKTMNKDRGYRRKYNGEPGRKDSSQDARGESLRVRNCTKETFHLQAAVSTIIWVSYNKPVWSFRYGSIQSRKT